MVYTDDFKACKQLDKKGLHAPSHQSLRTWRAAYTHTQTIEGFFGLFKNGVRGAYRAVSHKWLQGYLNGYAWRYNCRKMDGSMFHALLAEAVRS
jgi:transposase